MDSEAATAAERGTARTGGRGDPAALPEGVLYRAALDSSPRQIAVLDLQGRVLVTNARWHEGATTIIDPVSRELFLAGRYLEACRHERDAGSAVFAGYLVGLEDVLAGRQDRFAYEYVRRADRHWIRITAARAADGIEAVVLTREDITEVRRAEEALADQATELKRLALAAERTGNAVAITDAERRITWVNRGFTRLTGCRPDEALGQDLLAFLVCGRSDPATVASLRVSLRRGQGTRCELLSCDLNGREYWTDVDVQPLADAAGVTTGFIVVQADITKQVLLRLGLMASEQRLRVTIDSAGIGIYDIDLVNGTVTYDASWARILGYEPGEIRHLESTWQDLLHPDDRGWLAELVAGSRARGEATARAEYRVRRKDGRWIWLHDSARVVATDATGQATRVVGVMLDITARKEAEADTRMVAERLSLAAGAARLGVWDYDLANNRFEWNDRMREIYGIAGEGTADIRAAFRFIHPDDHARVRAEIAVALEAGQPLHTQYRIVRADGATRYLESWSTMDQGPDGQPRRSIGVIADATERVRRDEDRQQSQRLESIGQLAAGIAHEINTPTQYLGDNLRFLQDGFTALGRVVAALRGPAPPAGPDLDALLADADLDYLLAEIPRALEQSLEGITRVAGIVRAMKEFSHAAAERTPVDLPRAIASTVVVATNEWKYVAEVVTDFDPALPPVPVVPGEFNQLVLNLIVNAAHAIADLPGREPGSLGRITVRTRREGDAAVVAVSDTGCGMDEAVRARIFEPFFTTKVVGRGTGQGLAITHRVVQRHGGTIGVESAPGRGTTFTVRLPLGPAA
jgi:PAS domain S-box-containing protein